MRLLLGAALGLFVAACTCEEAAPAARESPAPEAPPPAAEGELPPAPRRAEPLARDIAGQIPAALLPPPELTAADRARADELTSLGGFTLGQSLAAAEARCVAVGGAFTPRERTIHRCRYPERAGEPRTTVDVSLTPGTDEVGRILFAYESGAGEPLVPSFVGATMALAERYGPPRSAAATPECATATGALLAACLTRALEAVRHEWSLGPRAAGDAARLETLGVEDAALSLRAREGQPIWMLTVEAQRRGYTQAFVDAYAD